VPAAGVTEVVEVRYRGRLGNQLFEYCLGRIIAGELGFALAAGALDGFPRTADRVDGATHAGGPEQLITDHLVDLDDVLRDRTRRKIVLEGYFQRYAYFHAHRDVIRGEWMVTDRGAPTDARPDDLVVHVRLGDYRRLRWVLPFSFYARAIESASWGRVVVCTDAPDDPFIAQFKRYHAVVRRDAPLDDFARLRAASAIVLSRSTFSWWAAFLSDAREIYFPIAPSTIWSGERPDIDLRVPEDRYRYLRVRGKYRPGVRECVEWLRRRVRGAAVEGTA
jgi:hypothetical protein